MKLCKIMILEVSIFINKLHKLDIFVKIHPKPKLENKPNPSWTRVSSFGPHIYKIYEKKKLHSNTKSVTRITERERERGFAPIIG